MNKQFYIIGLALIFVMAPVRADDKADSLAIVVSRKTSADNVAATELARCFRGEKSRDADGNKIVILMREHGSPERAAILNRIYRMTEQEYQTYFLQATFTGQVSAAPKKLNNAAAVRQFVADYPGAIGYVRVGDLDDTVKVLKIDGKAPGDEGYLLRLK